MRNLGVGVAVIAVAGCLYVFANRVRSEILWPAALLILAGAIGAAYLGQGLLRQRRLQNWSRTFGRIDSCIPGGVDEGSQEYTCTYVYSVNGSRQGGSFKFLDRPNRLEPIKAALVGEVISVLYNPNDSTKSIVEESRIKKWDIA